MKSRRYLRLALSCLQFALVGCSTFQAKHSPKSSVVQGSDRDWVVSESYPLSNDITVEIGTRKSIRYLATRKKSGEHVAFEEVPARLGNRLKDAEKICRFHPEELANANGLIAFSNSATNSYPAAFSINKESGRLEELTPRDYSCDWKIPKCNTSNRGKACSEDVSAPDYSDPPSPYTED